MAEEYVTKPVKSRARRYRERLQEAGYRQVAVWLDSDAYYLLRHFMATHKADAAAMINAAIKHYTIVPSNEAPKVTISELDTRIEALKMQLKQLQAQKAMLEARKRAAEVKRKWENTRCKILLGAAILAKVQRGEWPELSMLNLLDQELTRTEDRALFGLPEKPALPLESNGVTE